MFWALVAPWVSFPCLNPLGSLEKEGSVVRGRCCCCCVPRLQEVWQQQSSGLLGVTEEWFPNSQSWRLLEQVLGAGQGSPLGWPCDCHGQLAESLSTHRQRHWGAEARKTWKFAICFIQTERKLKMLTKEGIVSQCMLLPSL